MNKIFSPDAVQVAIPGTRLIENPRPVPKELVEKELANIFSQFAKPGFREVFSERFVDVDRLVDTIAIIFPQEVKLKLLNLRSVQTLEQRLKVNKEEKSISILSKVVADVSTQLELNDRDQGFKRAESELQLILNLEEKYTEKINAGDL